MRLSRLALHTLGSAAVARPVADDGSSRGHDNGGDDRDGASADSRSERDFEEEEEEASYGDGGHSERDDRYDEAEEETDAGRESAEEAGERSESRDWDSHSGHERAQDTRVMGDSRAAPPARQDRSHRGGSAATGGGSAQQRDPAVAATVGKEGARARATGGTGTLKPRCARTTHGDSAVGRSARGT